MSGIISLINLNNEPVNQSLLRGMTDYMAFRGPDARQTWHKDNIGLGHTLLRTTSEQEHERQPFTLDERVWIAADVRLDGRKNLVVALQARVGLSMKINPMWSYFYTLITFGIQIV